jgi:RHS repeat-associated protein
MTSAILSWQSVLLKRDGHSSGYRGLSFVSSLPLVVRTVTISLAFLIAIFFAGKCFGQATGQMNIDRYLHAATVLSSGQVLIAGGESCSSGVCTFLNSAELYNPANDTYTYTGSMSQARSAPAVVLNNGNVLIAGGYFCDASGNCSSLDSAELYNPSAGTFTGAGTMTVARGDQTMTVLNDGTVLIAGGQTCTTATSCTALSSAEIYDPVAGTFTATANNMSASRYGASAVALNSGLVLISGGFDGSNLQPTAEIYDPTVPGFTGNGPTLNISLFQPTSTLLNNGQVLVAGGSACGISGVSSGPLALVSTGCPTNDAELYDPNANSFSETNGMNDSRWLQTATLLTNGQVMLAGGLYYAVAPGRSYWQDDVTTELFDPTVIAFNYDESINGIAGQTATRMPSSGNVLLTGGISQAQTTSQEQWYQLAASTAPNLVSIAITPSILALAPGQTQQLVTTGTFSNGSVQNVRATVWTCSNSSAAVITNSSGNAGTVNAQDFGATTITATIGTVSASASLTVVTSTSIALDSSDNPLVYGTQLTLTATLNPTAATGTVTFLDGTTVLGSGIISGGIATYTTSTMTVGLHSIAASYSGDANDAPGLSQLLVQTVYTTSGGSPGNMNIDRYLHAATVLSSGQVLIAGGESCSSGVCTFLNSAELYNPANDTYTYTGSMSQARSAPAVVLNNGNVLIAGGYFCDASGNCSSLDSAELYNPSAGTFTGAGTMTVARGDQTMTVLNDGTVLIAGGQTCTTATSCTALSSAEIYDPVAGTFTATANNMSASRYGASAVALNSGLVLISGGFDGSNLQPTAEIYDPTVPGFTGNGPTLNISLFQPTSTLLNNGQVLVAGGSACGISGVSSGPLALVSTGCPTNDAELYDPNANSFSETNGMNDSRWLQTATLLTNGQVMLAGGLTNGSCRVHYIGQTCYWQSDSTTELFDPSSGAFNYDQSITGVAGQTATLMPSSGNALLLGGIADGQTTSQEQWYQPPTYAPPGLVSISVLPSNFSLTPGQTQSLIATGTFSNGSVQALKTVVWTSSNPSVAIVSNSSGNAGTLYGLALGTTTITASAFSVSGSVSLSLVNTPVLALFSTANPSAYGSQVTLAAMLGTPTATGTVAFLDGNTLLGTAAINSGLAVYSVSTLALGSHWVTASYSGDASDAPGWSLPLMQMVNTSGTNPPTSPAGGASGGTGYIPYSSYTSNKFDIINNTNLNLILNVPVRAKAGLIPFNFGLEMNNQVTPGTAVNTSLLGAVAGWGSESHITESGVCPNPPQSTPTTIYRGYTFRDLTGAIRSFPNIQWDTGHCLGGRLTEQTDDIAADGSGLHGVVFLNSDGSPKHLQIQDLAGNLWNYNAAVANAFFTDKNGNTLQANSSGQFVDTTNTAVLTPTVGYGYNGNDTYTYNDASGNPQTVTVQYTNEIQQTAWGCGSGFPDISAHSVWMPTSVSFPDGTSLGIIYEHGQGTQTNAVTGRIYQLILPTGGTITYQYLGSYGGTGCNGSPMLLFRTENGQTTSFNRTLQTGTYGTYVQTIITLPFGGTETILSLLAGNQVYSDVIKDSSGNTVKTTLIEPNGSTNGSSLGGNPVRYLDTYTYLGTTSVLTGSKRVYTTLDSTYFALPTETKVYLPANSSTVYTDTVTSYASTSIGYPHTIVTTANGSSIASATYAYDGHYNQLSVSTLVGGTQQLTSSKTYNSNGTVATATDTFGAQTTNNISSCNGTMPTTTVLNGVTTTFSWDCNGNVIDSATDTNGSVQAQFTDPLYRPSQTTDQNNFSTQISYASNYGKTQQLVGSSTVTKYASMDAFGNSSSTQIVNGSSYDTVSSAYTGHYLASTSLPCSTSTVGGLCPTTKFTYAYDSVGRLSTKTDITTTPNATKVYSYNVNDTLVTTRGGMSPVVSTQTEVDGLGRLISVCEINSLPGSASCGQTHAATGFETTYAYNALGQLVTITQFANSNTPQQRTFTYDLLGRKLTENTPEGGLVQFWYDTAPSSPGVACAGTYNGKLVKRYDARGNTTCYAYDSIGRMTSVVYSGPGSTGVNKYFVYDSAVVNSQPMQHTTNRLAEAYTSTSRSGMKTTDLGFSYSARGDKTDVYEWTPHSGGYYHTTATYNANGTLATLGGVPGRPTWSFGLDPMGRFKTLSESSNCNGTCLSLVTAAFYSIGRPITIDYGSGDSDSFVYSATTGMESSYTLRQGSNTFKDNNLTWFPTGQLSEQVFADTIDSADAQTCTYSYDSLSRLTSDNCGSAWSQTFSYDPFGNIVKAGSSSFAATYNNKNQIATLGSNVPTYDASGNLLTINTGTLHTYTWDAENRVASIDGKILTYDALDRVAEEGSTLQILYGPTGKLGIQNGQTNTRTYLGLPEGAQVLYDGSSVVYVHPDLMGNGILGTNNTQGKVFDRLFAPFGEEYDNLGTTIANFTGNTQDLDSNLYDFTLREQSPVQGRWLNPDPSGMSAVSLGDPQTLNRYAYVRGSAMGMTDVNGLGSDWGWKLRSFLNGVFSNVDPPPGFQEMSNWMAGNTSAAFPDFVGTATVSITQTVQLPSTGTTQTGPSPCSPYALQSYGRIGNDGLTIRQHIELQHMNTINNQPTSVDPVTGLPNSQYMLDSKGNSDENFGMIAMLNTVTIADSNADGNWSQGPNGAFVFEHTFSPAELYIIGPGSGPQPADVIGDTRVSLFGIGLWIPTAMNRVVLNRDCSVVTSYPIW